MCVSYLLINLVPLDLRCKLYTEFKKIGIKRLFLYANLECLGVPSPVGQGVVRSTCHRKVGGSTPP